MGGGQTRFGGGPTTPVSPQGINSRTNTPVETWTGPKGKQSYTYVVEKNATMSFTWAFQRTPYHEAVRDGGVTPPGGGCGCRGAWLGDGDGCSRCQGRRYTSDVAKLYSINVTNVLGGVASFCRRCAPEPAGSCAPCPPGNAVDRSSGACQPCPPGTYLRGHPSDGIPACHPCGPGTHSNQVPVCPLGVGLRGVMSPQVMPVTLSHPRWVTPWVPEG